MTPAYRRPWLVTGATTLLLLATLTGCKEAGWAKDEELNQMKPPAGQLPPLPTSSSPPPPTSSSTPPPAPPPAPVTSQAPVTVTQTVPAPAPAPAPQQPARQPPVITIPLPGQFFNQ